MVHLFKNVVMAVCIAIFIKEIQKEI